MSHHDKQQDKQQKPGDNRQKPMDDKQKPMMGDKGKQPNQQQPQRDQMPRANEREGEKLPGERSDKDSIGQPVQLDRESQ